MKPMYRVLIAALPLVVACAKKSSESENPDAGSYDEYYSENPDDPGGDGSADGGEAPGQAVARSSSGTSSAGAAKARNKAKKIKAKKKPVAGDKKDPPHLEQRGPKPAPGEVRIDGIVPTSAPAGSVVEVFGAGLDQKGFVPVIGGVQQKVLEASEDRLVVQIKGGRGPLGVGQLTRGRGRRGARGGRVVAADKTTFPFTVMGKKAVFGVHTNPNHGLIGNVYKIPEPVTEIPAFDSLGEPVGTIAVDNLAVDSQAFDGTLLGQKGWFGIHFTGTFNVREAGDYKLCMGAGSGALLFLDGNMVIDNDGSHATEEKCEELAIEPGEYDLQLLYYQGEPGELGLSLKWAKDGGELEPIPAEAFFLPEKRAEELLRK